MVSEKINQITAYKALQFFKISINLNTLKVFSLKILIMYIQIRLKLFFYRY